MSNNSSGTFAPVSKAISMLRIVLEEWPRPGTPRQVEYLAGHLEARGAAQALRAAGAQDLRRPRLVGRVVAGGHGARVAPRAHGRRRHRQDARGVGPLRAGVREGARGAPFRGVLARDAPEARPRRREAALIGGARLPVIDELGFLPPAADGARPLFRAFADAYETQSVVIATNLGLSRWGSVFGDDRMAAAVIDRIVHHGRLVQFRGESHRVRHALMREG